MKRTASLFTAPALLAGLALPLSAQSQSTFYAAYEDGMALLAKGKMGAALAAFQRAAELRPKPGSRILTYGMNFLDNYHPWLKIAQCALAVKDLDTAEEALKRSAQYNAEPAGERQALQQKLQAMRTPAPTQAPAPTPTPAQAAPVPVQPQIQVPAQATPPAAASPVPAPAATAPPPADPKKALELKPGAGSAPAPATVPAPTTAGSPVPQQGQAASGAPAGTEPGPEPQAASPASRTPIWLGGGVGLLALAGTGVWAARRKRPASPAAVPKPNEDHIATVRLTDQDGTQLLDSKARGSQPARPAPEQTQQGQMRMGGYTLQKVLGKGACGITYMGIRDENGMEVAIKVPHPHMLEDPEFLARFHQEAALGARLVHPKIVRIIDPGPTEGTPWLAMELVRGVTLDQLLKEKGRLEMKELLAIALDIAEAIAYAHAQGVVHRDLKPANIMVGEKGAQVLDFGIARLTDGVGMTATQVFIGTPLYSSPEAIIHSRVGPGADRYALGIMLFEFLTGHPPFVGPTTFATLQMHQVQPLPDLAALVPGLDPRLVRLVNRLTDKKAENRPEDGEVITLLKQVAADL